MEETSRRGRKPSGPEYVQHLEGSAEAKRRLQVILETMTGQRGVLEACTELGLSESRFGQLREELLQAALERLERRPAGRPRKVLADAASDAMEEELLQLALEVNGARLREEIALVMPHLQRGQTEPEKKRRSGRGAAPGRAGGRSDDGTADDGRGGARGG